MNDEQKDNSEPTLRASTSDGSPVIVSRMGVGDYFLAFHPKDGLEIEVETVTPEKRAE